MSSEQDRVITLSSSPKDRPRKSFLQRLRRDTRGNTLAIVGAALVPIAGMIGSGVDVSRAYMAKTRLQSACDAASLAGRRAMTGSEINDAVRAEANKYFNFNFPQGLYKTAAFTPTITTPQAGTVRVQATTTIPTEIMQMFGFETLPLAVDCRASQNFVNTDIMLVLDVTGSMMCTPEESGTCGRTSEISTSRIVGLRQAVMALYDQLAPIQTQLQANGMRLRYGIVPFSSSVNVGALIKEVNPAYIADSWTYQSRTPISDSTKVTTHHNLNNSSCSAYIRARNPATGYPATQTTVTRPGSGTLRDCVVTEHYYNTDNVGNLIEWLHEARALNTAAYKTGNDTVTPTSVPASPTTSRWAGCIEERDTNDDINDASGYDIPADAWDLNVDHTPNNDATRWRPLWPEVVYDRNTSAGKLYPLDNPDPNASGTSDKRHIMSWGAAYVACPRPAQKLQAWTRDNLQTYVNNLVAVGGTYHDIGMIWGARLISAGGIFAHSPDTFNSMPVAKHIIFMTDGQIQPTATAYSAYGVEKLDKRVTGSAGTGDLLDTHKQRFKMLCNAMKGRNASIWVVAFATAADTSMQECASSASQFSASGSSQQLIDKFVEIGKNIGALRLTQ